MIIENILKEFEPIAKPICVAMERQKKHVSLIVHGRKVIAVGQNVYRSHPEMVKRGYRFEDVHSEIDAFNKIPYPLRTKKLTLLNFRYNRFGMMRNSRPCNICSPWCKEIFNKIFYTTDNGIEKL